MISYERIYKSDNIDFNKSKESKEWLICHYWYFSDGFKYQPYVCNGCHNFIMCVENLSNFFVLTIKNVEYGVYIVGVDKKLLFICYYLLFCFV